MNKPLIICLVLLALLASGVAGFMIADRPSDATAAAPTPASPVSAMPDETDGPLDELMPDCTKPTTKGAPCEVSNERAATKTKSSFAAGQQLYVQDIGLSAFETWQDALKQMRFATGVRAGGTPSYVVGQDNDSFWDLNRGAGGLYVAFGYTTTTNPRGALRNIVFSNRSNLTAPLSYRGDANAYIAGQGGFSKSPWWKLKNNPIIVYADSSGSQPPITAIGVRSCWNKARSCHIWEPPTADPNAKWEELPQDLNAGVGGNWIWLRVQRAAS